MKDRTNSKRASDPARKAPREGSLVGFSAKIRYNPAEGSGPMTSLEGESEHEGFSYSWNSMPRSEIRVSEKAYSYAWSSTGSDQPLQAQAEDPLTSQGGTEATSQAGAKAQGSALGALHGLVNIRSVGVIGWSAIAGSGAVFAIAEASPSIASQLGSIGGLWLGVSAAIWFLPKIVR